MNDHNPDKSISEAVLNKIRAGTVRRRSRMYFMLRVIAAVTISILLLVVSALVVSFILFSLHESGEQFLLGFGWQGIRVFFQLFPWVYAVVAVLLSILLEFLLKGFKFGYRLPLLNIFGGIVGVSIVLGIGIALTPLHSFLLHTADADRLPLVGPLYEHIFDPHEQQGACRGTVASIGTESFVLQHSDQDHDHDDRSFTIRMPHNNASLLKAGQHVLVFCEPQPDGTFSAKNIEILSSPPQ